MLLDYPKNDYTNKNLKLKQQNQNNNNVKYRIKQQNKVQKD